MKHRPPPFAILLVILILAAAGGYWYFSNNPQAWQQALTDFGLTADSQARAQVSASGFIEANEIVISAEISARIQAMPVAEGETVTSGQRLVQLDTALIDAQAEQIAAQIALAEAQLAQLKAGAPQADIAVAEAAVELAEAQRDAARQAWQDAILLRDNPQELNAQIDATYSQLAIAELQIEQAAFLRDAVELNEDLAEQFVDFTNRGTTVEINIPGIFYKKMHIDFPEGEKQLASVQWNLATMDLWQGWVNLEKAKAAQESAQYQLQTLLALRDNPLLADLQVAQAQADYEAKAAAVEIARANLDLLRAGPPVERVEVLEAQVEQAKSGLLALDAQRQKYTLVSPISGVVVEQTAHEGEIAAPGAPLLTVADLGRVTLTVFVPTSDYGRLRENQMVEVSVDSHPGETFLGTITHINDEAEFTPKNVQTKEERVSTVYAIKITLSNTDGRLKPGMPADALFVEALAAY